MQIFYAGLCILGALLPLAQFLPWLSAHGLDAPLFIQQATANPIAAFAWSDLTISALVVVAFVLVEGRRVGMRYASMSLLGLLIGISLALPLFLLMRERHLDAQGSS